MSVLYLVLALALVAQRDNTKLQIGTLIEEDTQIDV